MNINDIFITATPNASIEDMERWIEQCEAIQKIICRETVFNPFSDRLQDAIDALEINLEGARRTERMAEENAKYREDRPNA